MQTITEHNPTHLKAGIKVNAHAPIKTGPQNLKANQQLSFANQLTKLKQDAAQERTNQEFTATEFNPAEITNSAFQKQEDSSPTKKSHSSIYQHKGNDKVSEEEILKSLRQRESNREQAEYSESSDPSYADINQELTSSEDVKAALAQAHQAEIHDAAREGNVAEREPREQNGNSRKKQLANWEDLAPRITEDAKNRAVRIDIPGLNDLETLIVRMQKNQVSIQAVGRGSVMSSLQSREAELKSRLASKSIQLASLQAFDANTVTAGRKS